MTDDGGPNPISGYSVLQAADIEAATTMARGCPMVQSGHGSVKVAELIDM